MGHGVETSGERLDGVDGVCKCDISSLMLCRDGEVDASRRVAKARNRVILASPGLAVE